MHPKSNLTKSLSPSSFLKVIPCLAIKAVTIKNIIFLRVTYLIAKHRITYKKDDGERDFVRLLFGCIAATYFFLVLFKDVLGLISF